MSDPEGKEMIKDLVTTARKAWKGRWREERGRRRTVAWAFCQESQACGAETECTWWRWVQQGILVAAGALGPGCQDFVLSSGPANKQVEHFQ